MTPATRLRAHERLASPEQKRDLNREIFTIAASRYDRITRILSFGCDAAWKDELVAALPTLPAPACLDLACGTGDLTFRLATRYPQGRIVGIDLTEPMLALARTRAGNVTSVDFRPGDMARTGLADESLDIVTGGYALRNAGDLDEALAEIRRVLRPGGVAAFLDFSKPPSRVLQWLELLLLRLWGGFWGLLLHRSPGVYAYIADSLERFPDRRELLRVLESHGFTLQSSRLHFCGILQQIVVTKAPLPSRPSAAAGRAEAPPTFARRADLVEEMDRPDASPELLCRTLAQFGRVNRIFSRYRTLLARHVLADMAADPSRTYRFVDLGAGGCDIDRWLVDRCRRQGLCVRITAIERDPRVLRFAREANAGYPEIELVEGDVMDARHFAGADYLFANHLLHHLPQAQGVELIRQMDLAGPRAYVLSDIRRSRGAYRGFALAAPLLFRNSFVVADGLASIRRSFTVAEAEALVAAAAPRHPVTVRVLTPGRLVIVGGTRQAMEPAVPGR